MIPSLGTLLTATVGGILGIVFNVHEIVLGGESQRMDGLEEGPIEGLGESKVRVLMKYLTRNQWRAREEHELETGRLSEDGNLDQRNVDGAQEGAGDQRRRVVFEIVENRTKRLPDNTGRVQGEAGDAVLLTDGEDGGTLNIPVSKFLEASEE